MGSDMSKRIISDERAYEMIAKNKELEERVGYLEKSLYTSRMKNRELEEENKRLKKSMKSAGFEDNVGNLIKPPLGKRLDFEAIDKIKALEEKLEALEVKVDSDKILKGK